MEAARSTKTMVSYDIAIWRYNPRDQVLNLHRRESLKSRNLSSNSNARYQQISIHAVGLCTEI